MIKIQFIEALKNDYIGTRVLYSNVAILGNDGHFFIKPKDLFLPPVSLHVATEHVVFKSEYNHKFDFISNDKKLTFPFNLRKDDILKFDKFSIQLLDFSFEVDTELYSEMTKSKLNSIKKNSSKMKLIKALNELSK